MPHQSPEVRRVWREMDKRERRIAAAWLRSVEAMRARVPVRNLAVSISIGALRSAMRGLTRADILDSMMEVSELVVETVIKGGEMSEDDVNG
jgi:hypothetical protein